jgi:hypothetical protein
MEERIYNADLQKPAENKDRRKPDNFWRFDID